MQIHKKARYPSLYNAGWPNHSLFLFKEPSPPPGCISIVRAGQRRCTGHKAACSACRAPGDKPQGNANHLGHLIHRWLHNLRKERSKPEVLIEWIAPAIKHSNDPLTNSICTGTNVPQHGRTAIGSHYKENSAFVEGLQLGHLPCGQLWLVLQITQVHPSKVGAKTDKGHCAQRRAQQKAASHGEHQKQTGQVLQNTHLVHQ